jgi:hypothetical protein
MFKIPKKIVKAEDLPRQMQTADINSEYLVQLFPDEKPDQDITIARQLTPEDEIIIAQDEMTEIEKHVDEVIAKIVQNKVRPLYYNIVSGSFKNRVYADIFASNLKNMGYGNTYVRFFDNGFNRVIVQRYNNEVEARQYLDGYRADNPMYAGAWLYYKNNLSNEPTASIIRN